MKRSVAWNQSANGEPHRGFAANGVGILLDEQTRVLALKILFLASEDSLIEGGVAALHGCQVNQSCVDHRHGSEQLGMLEAQMCGPEAAHGEALDDPAFALGKRTVRRIDVGNKVL